MCKPTNRLALVLLALVSTALVLVGCSSDGGKETSQRDVDNDDTSAMGDVSTDVPPDDVTGDDDARNDATIDTTAQDVSDDQTGDVRDASDDTGDTTGTTDTTPDGTDVVSDATDGSDPDTAADADTTDTNLPNPLFSNLQVYTDGCEDELWGRWTNDRDWSLEEWYLDTVDGDRVGNIMFFTTPDFRMGETDTYLFDDRIRLNEPPFTLGITASDGTNTTTTLTVPVGLPPSNGLYTAVSARVDSALDVRVSFEPSFDGTLLEFRVYGDDTCFISGDDIVNEPLVSGETTGLNLGRDARFETTVHVILIAEDSSLQYGNYDILTFTL